MSTLIPPICYYCSPNMVANPLSNEHYPERTTVECWGAMELLWIILNVLQYHFRYILGIISQYPSCKLFMSTSVPRVYLVNNQSDPAWSKHVDACNYSIRNVLNNEKIPLMHVKSNLQRPEKLTEDSPLHQTFMRKYRIPWWIWMWEKDMSRL